MRLVTDNHIFTASQTKSRIWDINTFECVKEISGMAYAGCKVHNHFWLGVDNKILIFDSNLNSAGEVSIPNVGILTMNFDATQGNIWTSGSDKKIRIFASKTKELIKEIKHGKINVFNSTKTHMWSGGDSAITVWDLQTYERVRDLTKHEGAVYGLYPSGDYIWSTGWDTTVCVWDAKTFDCLKQITNFHSDCVSSVLVFFNHTKKIGKDGLLVGTNQL